MNIFLETFNLPQLHHDEIGNIKRLMTNKNIEIVINNFLIEKIQIRSFHWGILLNI